MLSRLARRCHKQRQLEYEVSHGPSSKAPQIQYDLNEEMQALKIGSVEELGLYPLLSQLEFHSPVVVPHLDGATGVEADARPDPMLLTAGPLKFEFSRKLQRCNIVHSDTMETAFIRVSERKCGGEVEFRPIAGDGWECSAWKMSIKFPQDEGDR